ncbi:TetR/AcrR family transcriptional regulator [Rhodococcus sp. NPDC055112]
MVREYRSKLREQLALANREAVVVVATEMFTARGWVATTMADVADAARLTRQTVYQQFNGKLALLDACIAHALAGGDGLRVRDQPTFQAMGVGDQATRIRAGGHWLRGAHERSAAIQYVLDQAAVTDGDAAARLAVRESARWNEVAHASTLIVGHRPHDDVIDAMWVLANRRWWLLLVGERGWNGDRWERWFEDAATATFTM